MQNVKNLSLRGKVFGKKINKFLSLKIKAKLVFRPFTKLRKFSSISKITAFDQGEASRKH